MTEADQSGAREADKNVRPTVMLIRLAALDNESPVGAVREPPFLIRGRV
ncbi:MAG: hypothetical protein ACYSTL_07450 [Planctomycetota bacterium]